MALADVIEFEIIGEDLQCVRIELDPGEAVVAEAGALMMMEDGVEMRTVFGDGSGQERGFLGRLVAAGKRLLVGESLFMTVFRNAASTVKSVYFAAPYPGRIIPIHLARVGGCIVAQKDSFLCAARGVSISVALTRRLGAGFFGGEGFILEKIEGDGWVFLHTGGVVVEKQLRAGELLRVDTGCVVAFTAQVDYDIEFVKGIKNFLFGGEGLFFTVLRGPGMVWIQSLPFNRLADRVLAGASRGKEEGSVLGGMYDLLSGD